MRGSGDLCLNGAAARLVQPGDRVIVISYADYDDAELDGYAPRVVHVDTGNRQVDEVTAELLAEGARGARRRTATSRCRPTGDGRGDPATPADRPRSTCWSSGRAWPACRRRCGRPTSTACGSACSPRASWHQATTRWAQGGVAAVLGGDPDSTDLHLADTLAAGAGLCDEDAVRVLVDEGPARVNELIALGAMFDRDAAASCSWPARAATARAGRARRRRGHRRRGRAGAGGGVRRTAAAVYEHWFALDLLVEHGRCGGRGRPAPPAAGSRGAGPHVLLATGGAGSCSRSRPTPPSRPATASPWRCGPAWRWPTSSSCSSTRRRCTTRRCPGRCCPRRSGATALLLRDSRRALRRRAAAPGQGEPGDHGGARRAGRRPRVARRHRARAVRPPVPDHRRRPAGGRASTPARDWLPWRRPPTTCAAASWPTSTAPRRCPASGWRARRLHRRPRGQPPGVQLAARRHGLRAPGWRRWAPVRRSSPHGGHAVRAGAGVGRPGSPGWWCRPRAEAPDHAARRGRGRGAAPSSAHDRRAGVLRSAASRPRREAPRRSPQSPRPRTGDELRNLATVGGRALAAGGPPPRAAAPTPAPITPPDPAPVGPGGPPGPLPAMWSPAPEIAGKSGRRAER